MAERAIVPNQIEAEIAGLDVARIDAIRQDVAEGIAKGESRTDVLAHVQSSGLSNEAASWLFTQVKDKGAAFEVVIVGTGKIQAETQQRSKEYRQGNVNLGGGLWLLGFLLVFPGVYMQLNQIGGAAILGLASFALRLFGLLKFADAKGYDWPWALSSLCGLDLFAMLFIALAPRRG